MNHLINCILYSGPGPRSLKNNHVTIYDSYHEFSKWPLIGWQQTVSQSEAMIENPRELILVLTWICLGNSAPKLLMTLIITHHKYWKAFINLDSCINVSFLNMKWILVCMQRSHKKLRRNISVNLTLSQNWVLGLPPFQILLHAHTQAYTVLWLHPHKITTCLYSSMSCIKWWLGIRRGYGITSRRKLCDMITYPLIWDKPH